MILGKISKNIYLLGRYIFLMVYILEIGIFILT